MSWSLSWLSRIWLCSKDGCKFARCANGETIGAKLYFCDCNRIAISFEQKSKSVERRGRARPRD